VTSTTVQHEYNGESFSVRQNSMQRTDFGRLLHAVLREPEKVPAIVKERPAILEETNFTNEAVLHWLAVESHTEGIRLLRGLGARIPVYALVETVEGGHLETIILLLELGADPESYPVERMLRRPLVEMSKRIQQIIRSYFMQFGYAVSEPVQGREDPAALHR